MEKLRPLGICLFLVALTWLVFGQTLGHDFINQDDPDYVFANPHVASGLTRENVAWAFTHTHSYNWHPLTWISHMIDCQLFALRPGPPHAVNVLLHTIAVLLLFLVLWRMTGALWRSGFVAAVFAIHPLRVESVAWIAERKDVLSAVFFMPTLGAYLRYTRQPSFVRYALVASLFACGLMAKPMLVTLPLVLLLLDYWPLERQIPWKKLIAEKIPLFALSAASCAMTVVAQRGAINSLERMAFTPRLSNALASCIVYLRQTFWPGDLAIAYRYIENRFAVGVFLGALVVLAGITAAVIAYRKKHPAAAVGWFWYLGMLLPVIGLVQVGPQAHADRYTYLPQIGLGLALIWTMAELSARWKLQRQILGVAAAFILSGLAWQAFRETAYWRDSETLWNRALALAAARQDAAAPKNGAFFGDIHYNLGNAFFGKDRFDEAIAQYQTALRLDSNYPAETYSNLGQILIRKKQLDQAIPLFRQALQIKSGHEAEMRYSLGNALLQTGQPEEAIAHLQKYLETSSAHAETVHYNIASALVALRRVDEALPHYEQAIAVRPDYAQAHNNFANALLGLGRVDEADPALSRRDRGPRRRRERGRNSPQSRQRSLAKGRATRGDGRIPTGDRAPARPPGGAQQSGQRPPQPGARDRGAVAF